MNPTPQTFFFFFFNDTATTEIYTLSLHDALPIFGPARSRLSARKARIAASRDGNMKRSSRRYKRGSTTSDRKSTRLNSSHQIISYAVFCLKKKKYMKMIIKKVHKTQDPY